MHWLKAWAEVTQRAVDGASRRIRAQAAVMCCVSLPCTFMVHTGVPWGALVPASFRGRDFRLHA